MSCTASIQSISRPCGQAAMGGIRRVALASHDAFIRSVHSNAIILFANGTPGDWDSAMFLYAVPSRGVMAIEAVNPQIVTNVETIIQMLGLEVPDNFAIINIQRTGASVNSEMIRNDDTGVFYYEHTLALPLGFISEDASALLYGLQNAPIIAVAETWDGRLLFLGDDREAAQLTAATIGTGENFGESPNTQFTIVARSLYPLLARLAPVNTETPLAITPSQQAQLNETFMESA